MADPGFPVGGRRAVGGAPTSDVGTFWQKHMQKQKKWIPLRGEALVAPPGSANAYEPNISLIRLILIMQNPDYSVYLK